MPKPSVGRIVHYVSYGTPGGRYKSECRAAIITAVSQPLGVTVDLAVLNPTGMFFNRGTVLNNDTPYEGGTWHWPERVDDEG